MIVALPSIASAPHGDVKSIQTGLKNLVQSAPVNNEETPNAEAPQPYYSNSGNGGYYNNGNYWPRRISFDRTPYNGYGSSYNGNGYNSNSNGAYSSNRGYSSNNGYNSNSGYSSNGYNGNGYNSNYPNYNRYPSYPNYPSYPSYPSYSNGYAQRRPETRIEGPDRPSLYDENDDVLILNDENYREKMYNQDQIIVVEFYAHWCGHCKRFSSTYKSLAESVKDWHSVVKVAALNCADELNKDVCRLFGVRGYPTIRLIPARTSSGSGIETEERELDSLTKAIIRQVEVARGIHKPPQFPTFRSLRDDFSSSEIDRILATRPSTERIVISFQTDLRASLAKEIALDALSYKGVSVYSARLGSTLARQYGVLRPDTIVLVDRSGHKLIGHSRADVQRYFTYNPNSVVNPTKTSTLKPTTSTTTTTTTTTTTSTRRGRPTLTAGGLEEDKEAGLNVYEIDLESALHYSLRQEIGMVNVFRDESLDALKAYVKALAKYFPGREPVRQWLDILDRKLNHVGESLTHKEYEDLIEYKTATAFLPDKTEYLGCKGSEEGKRGYPCSLWTLFHTLSVSAYKHHNLTSRSSPEFKPQEILEVMTKYVKNFFGCRHCAKHFLGMASEPREIFTYEGSVLWLWHAHNRVNYRLKGDETEDPQFPKQLFPSQRSCPHCRIGKHRGLPIWNLGNVMNFLARQHSRTRLRLDGIPTIAPWNPGVSTTSGEERYGPYRWFEYTGKGAIF